MNVFNIVLGGVVVFIGLTFWWALTAIIIGTMLGVLLIALHATQGPKLGVPQTIQSRGQFGFYGAAFPFPCVLLLNIGFIAAQLVIRAQSMQGVIASISIPQWILILAVPAVVIGIFGYRWIPRAMQVTVAIVGLSLVIMFIQGLRYGSAVVYLVLARGVLDNDRRNRQAARLISGEKARLTYGRCVGLAAVSLWAAPARKGREVPVHMVGHG